MIIKSKIVGLPEWLFIEDVPDKCAPNSPISEKRTGLQRTPVKMESYQISAGGMFLLHSDMSFDRPVKIHTEVKGETITSQFVFYRKISGSKQKDPGPGRSRHNVRYIPSSAEEYELQAGLEYSYFLMVLSKEFYFKLIDPASSLHEHFVQAIMEGRYTSFAKDDMVVTYEMQRVISDLKDTRRSGEARRIHTESKISELLLYQFEQLQDSKDKKEQLYPKEDVNKLLKARNILDEHYAEAPTQKELAAEVTMNEFKLRQLFKDYFSVTIHDYLTRVRMEKARNLLLDERKSIFEVAQLTGYNHQQNFSVAFKKYFGIAPSDLKM